MEWQLILLACILLGHLLTIVSSDHKHIVVHIPYKVRTIHHKRTVAKDIGGGSGGKDHVIGFSGGEDFGRLQSMLDATPGRSSFGESYGGGHGQNWLQATQASQRGANGFGNRHNFVNIGQFGGGFGGADSFEGGFGGERVSLVDRYFAGPDGLDTNLKHR